MPLPPLFWWFSVKGTFSSGHLVPKLEINSVSPADGKFSYEFILIYVFYVKNAEEIINLNSQLPEDLLSHSRPVHHSWSIPSVLLMGPLEIRWSHKCLNNSSMLIFKHTNPFPSLSPHSRIISETATIQNLRRHSLPWSCQLSASLNFAP